MTAPGLLRAAGLSGAVPAWPALAVKVVVCKDEAFWGVGNKP